MPPKNDRIQVVTPPRIRAAVDEIQELTSTPGLGAAVVTMLTLHLELLHLELRRIPLTRNEADTLAAITGGPTLTAGVGAILIGEVLDAIDIAGNGPSSIAAHHDVDTDALVDKLRGIGPSADLALRLAFARWWAMPEDDRDYPAAGLRIVSD